MTFVERITSKLPVLRRTQACEACGNEFSCEIGISGCWCAEIELSDETRQYLRATYTRCLCRACLENAESRAQDARARA